MATSIGPILKRLRERSRLTQQDVVDYANIDRSASYVSAIETGKTSPTLFELERIAQVFRTTAVDLILEAQEGQSAAPTGGDVQRILALYERLPENQRDLAVDLLQFLVDRSAKPGG
ncbi:MAG: helix-turn-helix domain-containing protein [Armatimonadetes bacterium]|nr:helix-turn-helix domain-containing protein [Armatimonadota bacterium]